MRSDVGNVSHPSLVRFIVLELALQLVGRNQCWLAHFVSRPLVPMHRLNSSRSHESRDTVFSAGHTCFTQVTEDAWTAVDTHTLVIELFDLQS
jgi:hypothetical protein